MSDAVQKARKWLAGWHGDTIEAVVHVSALLAECVKRGDDADNYAGALAMEQQMHDETRGYRQKAEQERDARVDSSYAHCDVETCCAHWTVARCDEHALVKRLPPDPDIEPEPL